MNIEIKTDDKKKLLNRLKELTGITPAYDGVPRCSYTVGPLKVEKDGSITFDEDTLNMNMIDTLNDLANEDLIEYPDFTEAELMQAEGRTETNDQNGTEEATPPVFPIDTTIEFPISSESKTQVRNLINEIYSRGKLINKAIGSNFYASKELVEKIEELHEDGTCERMVNFTRVHDQELKGLEFTYDRVRFTGFPPANSPEDVDAFMNLAELMMNAAKNQKRIQAKEVNEDNEKYIMRVWLIRLGMKGSRYKSSRQILLKDLTGNGAFRTEEQATAAREKAKAQRAAAKAGQVVEALSSQTEKI